MTDLLLARHGETDDNCAPLRFQGWRDTPLNDRGREQALELAGRLQDVAIGSIWCSGLSRADETARIVGAARGLEPIVDLRLREGSRGEWEGYTFDEVAHGLDPEGYAAWKRGGAGWRFPGGESLQEHSDRVAESLADIRAAAPLPALVVCHGGSIRTVLCATHPDGLDAFHSFAIANVAVYELDEDGVATRA